MIAIIDYGVGNLRSVEKAFQYIGCYAQVTSERKTIENSDAVVLPGVGAFSAAMESLERVGMVDVVRRTIAEKRLFLGICLGMQLLFDYSEEGGVRVDGLGIFKGSIRQLPQNIGIKVPHMGWNSLKTTGDSPLFKGLPADPYVYFVHSYYLEAADREIVAATTEYGVRVDAAVGSGRAFATQFHPEKSGEVGLEILKNWSGMI